ncbi:cobalt transport protein (plasmid) [Pseudanabaena biceps]|nr:cobalt transport protein [Pseudanabaena biceps]
MTDKTPQKSKPNSILILTGIAVFLAIAAFISPFASQDPDGLERVAQDLKFENKALKEPITKQIPPAQIFDEYSFKAVENPKVSTALAGIAGTLLVFGLSWGLGELTIRRKP